MTVPERIIPPANLPPGSQQWGREQQALAVANRDELNALSAESDLAYKQLNSAVNGAANQTTKVRNLVYSLPNAYVSGKHVENFSLPANQWTYFTDIRTPQVRNKTRVTIFVTLNVRVAAGAPGSPVPPQIFIAMQAGSGEVVYSRLDSVDYTPVGGPYYRLGQFTHSVTFKTERGKNEIGLVYAGVYPYGDIAAHADNRLDYSVYTMYGGEETE